MFTGKYEAKIDSVGRVTIPARLREELGKRFIVTAGLDDCLWAYPEEQWSQDLALMLQTLPTFSRGGERAIRFLTSSAQPVDMDKQWRVVLPEALRQHVEIKDEVVFVGMVTRVEIWPSHRWKREEVMLQSDDTRNLVRELLENCHRNVEVPPPKPWDRSTAKPIPET